MKLQELRRVQALSIEELAERAGVAASTISRIEQGRKPRRYEPVRKIAQALQVDPQLIDEFRDLVGTPEALAERKRLGQQPSLNQQR